MSNHSKYLYQIELAIEAGIHAVFYTYQHHHQPIKVATMWDLMRLQYKQHIAAAIMDGLHASTWIKMHNDQFYPRSAKCQ